MSLRNLESTRRNLLLSFAFLLLQDLALVHPALHADHAVGCARFTESEVDVCTQRMQRKASLQIPLRPRDFIPVQTSADANLDSLATEPQRRIYRLAHGAPETHAFLQLQRNRFRHQLRVEFGLMDFLDIDENVFAAGALLQLRFQLVDFRTLAPDDDPRPRRLDDDAQLVAGTLDLNCADASRLELLFQLILQLHILVQLFVVVPLSKPARLPRLGKPKPESVRMDFLSHCFS